jgi:deoxyribodipyrimidine photolyase
LRVHDNKGLTEAQGHKNLLNIFIIDPYFWEKCDIHENRLNFLLETLRDLDSSLKKLG